MISTARPHLDGILAQRPAPASRAVARVVAMDPALARSVVSASGIGSLVAAVESMGPVAIGRLAERTQAVQIDVRAAGLRAELAARICQALDPAEADLAYTAGLLCTLTSAGLPKDVATVIDAIGSEVTPLGAAARSLWHAVRAIAGLESGDVSAAQAAAIAADQDVAWIESWWLERVMGMPPEPCPLTRSELRVLRELASRRVVKEAAHSLGCSPNTVYNHLHNTYRKLDVAGQSHALLAARESGWI